MWKVFFVICILIFPNLINVLALQGEGKLFWQSLDNSDIEDALIARKTNDGVAKNVILFIGDGMGPTTVTSARIYGKTEQGHFAFEKFPHLGAIKTYNADTLVSDSASTATAIYSGVKTNYKTVGVENVALNDCTGSLNGINRLDNIFDWAEMAGKVTGFVTTTRVTHATPASLYAHTANRKWECESSMTPESRQSLCKDIARQLIEDNSQIRVIMGGGRQCLQSDVIGTAADPIDGWACYSTDGRNLIEKWMTDKMEKDVNYSIVQNNKELQEVNGTTEYLLGIFANGHLKFDYERDSGPNGMPSLSEMTAKAIEVLRKNSKGFILMVEGGLIDYGHHRGKARKALDETVIFNEAVQTALDLMYDQLNDTLIVVTADHAHSDVFTGYSKRTKSILDIAGVSVMDQIPYTSLLYANGGPENFQFEIKNNKVQRKDPSTEDTTDFEYSQQATVLTDEVYHSGVDVMVYAKGPMAHLFHRVHEQTYIAHVISYAARIGRYKDRPLHNKANTSLIISNLLTIISGIVLLKPNNCYSFFQII